MPTITFIVDPDGNFSLELKGPESIHDLRAVFDADLAELGGTTETVQKPELTEKPQPQAVRAPGVRQAQSQ